MAFIGLVNGLWALGKVGYQKRQKRSLTNCWLGLINDMDDHDSYP